MSRTTRENWIDKCMYVQAGMPMRWISDPPYATWNDLLTGIGTAYEGGPSWNPVALEFAGNSSHLPENNPWDWLRRFGVIVDPRVDYDAGEYHGMPPGAVPVAARLKVHVLNKYSWGTKPTFNVYALTPETPGSIVPADYSRFESVPFCDLTVPYDDLVIGERHSFEFNAAGLAYLNFSDFISLGLRMANLDVGGIEHELPDSGILQSCGAVLACMYYTDTKPILEIDYESPPLVASIDAEDVDYHSARLKGRLMLDGGLACQGRFEYGETLSFGEVTDWQVVTENNQEERGYFTANITGLDSETEYYFRAVAANSMGTDYGHHDYAYRTFTTVPGSNRSGAMASKLLAGGAL